jgi:hypothetical protein
MDVKIIIVDGEKEYLGRVSDDGLQIINAMDISDRGINQAVLDDYIKEVNVKGTSNITLDQNSSKIIRDLDDNQKIMLTVSETIMIQSRGMSMAMWENKVFDRLRNAQGTTITYTKPKVKSRMNGVDF